MAYILHAKASVEAPGELRKLIKQRKTWNNTSLFGSMNIIKKLGLFSKGSKGCCRICGVIVFLLYSLLA